jgi:diadenosine tetraphosphate (Ap4A) HIT family hydrolase
LKKEIAMFELHPKLKEDCFVLGDFSLCTLLMMNDHHYPWFILVPKREKIKEAFELTEEEQAQLNKEVIYFSHLVKNSFQAQKMNVATLGNMVPQLHVHVIARFDSDVSWPNPVWGHTQAKKFEKEQLLNRVDILMAAFKEADYLDFKWQEQWL